MKRAIVSLLVAVLIPLTVAGCKPRFCPEAPSGDCNPRPTAPSPTSTDHCTLTVDGCILPPSKKS